MDQINKGRFKVAVIGGGTGLPVILKGLKKLDAHITCLLYTSDAADDCCRV